VFGIPEISSCVGTGVLGREIFPEGCT
jgi:hypothetical protein